MSTDDFTVSTFLTDREDTTIVRLGLPIFERTLPADFSLADASDFVKTIRTLLASRRRRRAASLYLDFDPEGSIQLERRGGAGITSVITFQYDRWRGFGGEACHLTTEKTFFSIDVAKRIADQLKKEVDAARKNLNSDDGVDFIEDGSTPTPDADFIGHDEAAADSFAALLKPSNEMMACANARLPTTS